MIVDKQTRTTIIAKLFLQTPRVHMKRLEKEGWRMPFGAFAQWTWFSHFGFPLQKQGGKMTSIKEDLSGIKAWPKWFLQKANCVNIIITIEFCGAERQEKEKKTLLESVVLPCAHDNKTIAPWEKKYLRVANWVRAVPYTLPWKQGYPTRSNSTFDHEPGPADTWKTLGVSQGHRLN